MSKGVGAQLVKDVYMEEGELQPGEGHEDSDSSDASDGEDDVIEKVLRKKVPLEKRRTLRAGVSRRLKLMLVFMAE